jgi:hypothetical protein
MYSSKCKGLFSVRKQAFIFIGPPPSTEHNHPLACTITGLIHKGIKLAIIMFLPGNI